MATTTSTTSTTSAASSLATTSLVTALGGGSGVDMAALANNLAIAQFATRTDQLTTKADKLNTQISTASNIKSMLLAIDTSLGTLVRSGDLARTPNVANSAVATGGLTGSTTPTGTYSLEVTKLASAQQIASKAYAAKTDLVGAGTLTLRFGTVSGSSFSEDTTHAAVNITVDSDDTLADVATKINAANSGVTAYVAQTVDGAQLVLKGAEGAKNAFTLQATENADAPGLSNLAWTPGSTTGTVLATAGDASLKVDGLSITSASNTLTDVIPGVKLTLTGTNTGAPTTVSFADPTTSIASSMQDLVDALNEVVGALNTATAVGGDLANDSGARSLKRALSGLGSATIMPNATGMAKTLADLGLKTQRDGTFTLDNDRLTATIAADPDGVAAMFTNGINGVFGTLDKIYRTASSSTDTSSLGGSISRYTKQLAQVASDQSDLADQQEALRARLASQFTVSETRISVSKSTLSMLQGQIAQWNKSSD
ncbi:flagellar hook-associated protein 2 [Novosphingobium sp. PhB165]|uniref:flagellar filament capping protein FliD n=1 Tax=Novosphingobium sp. PhB165 TaxID=2485105 RepID=UPI001047E6BD|nr:flagellar filament capping protein FliD [Novosphingobium sp. PhB165]TCM18850.1 flagellar hook-associated protein 2 [Novosphingobium sp. PhB165]